MEKLEIVINEMVADDGTHHARTTQGDKDMSKDMSHDDVCGIAWKGYKAGKGADKQGPNGAGTWYRGRGADEWASGKKDDGGKKGGKKGSKGSKSDGTVTKTKNPMGPKEKAKAKARAKLDIATISEGRGTSE